MNKNNFCLYEFDLFCNSLIYGKLTDCKFNSNSKPLGIIRPSFILGGGQFLVYQKVKIQNIEEYLSILEFNSNDLEICVNDFLYTSQAFSFLIFYSGFN